MKRKPSQAEQQFVEGNKVLTNNDLGGDLNLIYAYNRKRRELEASFRELEASFRESLKRLDSEFSQRTGRCAGDELDKLCQAKLKSNPDLTYSMAFSEVQTEHPALTQQYELEVRG